MVQNEIQMAINGKKSLFNAARAIGITSQEMNYFKNKPSYFDTLLRKNFMSNTEFLEVIKNNQLPEELLVKAAFRIDKDIIISLSDDEIEEIINFINNELRPREKKVIYTRFYDGLTLEQTGKVFNITRERIRQIEVKAIRKLTQHLYWFFKSKYAKKIFTINDLIDFTKIHESRIEKIIRLTMSIERVIHLDEYQTNKAKLYFKDNKLENLADNDIIQYFKENPLEFHNFLKILYVETDATENNVIKYATNKKAPIESYVWSFRAYNCLKRKGINTFEDFNNFSLEELMNIRNLGRKSFNEIITNIRAFNDENPPYKQINIKGL